MDTSWHNDTRRTLLARFEHAWESTSWAMAGGGLGTALAYVCFEVRNADLPRGVDPGVILKQRLVLSGLDSNVSSSVATMTSADVSAYSSAQAEEAGVTALVLTTAGYANALRVGEAYRSGVKAYLPGTINLACWVNQPLTLQAKLEAQSIVVQARTLEVLEAQLPSLDETGWATGTGTDCVALFSRVAEPAQGRQIYAGMHTALGRVVGQAVRSATRASIERWRKRVRL